MSFDHEKFRAAAQRMLLQPHAPRTFDVLMRERALLVELLSAGRSLKEIHAIFVEAGGLTITYQGFSRAVAQLRQVVDLGTGMVATDLRRRNFPKGVARRMPAPPAAVRQATVVTPPAPPPPSEAPPPPAVHAGIVPPRRVLPVASFLDAERARELQR